ncbi:unnamed protein product [Cochlearia groenlandica]
MSETHQVQNSTESTRSLDKIEDNFKKMNVNEDNVDESSERDCKYFLRTGLCSYGDACRYNHPLLTHLPQGVSYYSGELPQRIGEPDCEYFLKTGACKYASTCKYHHPNDRNGAGPVLFNFLGYPMRQGEESCAYYMQTGTCRFGVACKFHHPHLPYAGGSTMYGPMTYPQVHQAHAYMPFMVSPYQGWTSYMAASNGSSSVTPQHHSFSERGECKFFMNTGTCKYGDDCKYTHPKEKMLLQSPPNLPIRPGQQACGNFKAYGFCGFGANCKFDHSTATNPNNNTGMTIPASPPSRSDSPALLPATENHSLEKHEDSPVQMVKSEVNDSLPISRGSDSIVLPNGKHDAENPSVEIEKLENSDS